MPYPQASRMLRLAIAAGMAAAVLCLVVGLTTLVVKIGTRFGPSQSIAIPDAVGTFASQDALPAPPSGQSSAGQVRTVQRYQGKGQGQRGPFLIGTPGTWGLSWAFSCGPDHGGQFTATATGRSPVSGDDIAVAVSGPAGHGISWAVHDPGNHVLSVNSRCTWVIRVVLLPSRR